jgi:hypothetical protein
MSSNGHPTGHVHLLGDHRAPRPTKAEQEATNLKAVEDRVRAIATDVAEHYIAQVPGLVAHMLGEMLHANGFALKAPESWKATPAVAPVVAADQSGDAAVLESAPLQSPEEP